MTTTLAVRSAVTGEEARLPVDEHRQYFERARKLAEAYAPTHPGVLSASMLIGRCDLGLARLAASAHENAEGNALATAVAAEFTKVLAAHPIQPEASAMLTQARVLRDTPLH